MSLSTWLFGKKKSPTSPPETDTSVQEFSEEYVFIEKRQNNPILPNTGENFNSMYPQLPYSLGPGPGLPHQHQPILRHESSMDSSSIHHAMLRDVPFKLSTELDTSNSKDLREISARANDVLFLISQIKSEDYDYNFSVENSTTIEQEFDD